MPWPAIDTVRGWMSKRKGLLTGLLGVAAEEVVELVPGGKLALKIVSEVASYGVERLRDAKAEVPDVKPAGQVLRPEQLDEINAWLGTLTASYAGLLDQVEKLTAATGDEPVEELTALVKRTLSEREDLMQQFDATAHEVRRLTLSLSRVEEKLDVFFHGQQRIGLCLEDIKEVLVNSPLPGEWAEFRKSRPEAVQALNRADEDFLAGRREEGAQELLGLLRQRGVGEQTVCRALGIEAFARGQLDEASDHLARSGGGKQAMAPGLVATLTTLGTAATRGPGLPVWRSLPRGLVVDRRYRIEAEVGRGGMASVYRAVGIDLVNSGRVVALKVPTAELLTDPAARDRFVTEIRVSQKLSGKHPAIIETFGYSIFDDPHSGLELFGLVMEYVDGLTVAQLLAQRQAKNKPVEPGEIVRILKPVCEALEYAHSQGVCHRDIKPQNVLLTRKSQPKLADFGIARVLEDARSTVAGQADMGTLAYMPPDRDFDARSDVYLMGNLLLELLTFDARGDVEARADCPAAWVELVADSMNRLKGKRPQTAHDFLARLEGGHKDAPPPPPPSGDHVPPPSGLKQFKQPPEPSAPLPGDRTRPQEVVNSLGMKLVLVRAGPFWMGDRGSQKLVQMPRDFYMGVFQVTQGHWQAVMRSNPSYFSRKGGAAKDEFSAVDIKQFSVREKADLKQFPVEQVSWDDVQEFLKRLNVREKDGGFLYRLPTEAEWEYACRGGVTSQEECDFDFYFGDPDRNLSQPANDLSSEQANFNGNYPAGNAPKGKHLERTSKVGSYRPNRLGIFDMHGNVWEWCEDPFETGGAARVFRGGGWNDFGSHCRASIRGKGGSSVRGNDLGFRILAVASGE
jgi:formylglycine-generating enzyme required for sulfatase activity